MAVFYVSWGLPYAVVCYIVPGNVRFLPVSELTVAPLARDFYARPTLMVARALLGKTLWHATPDGVTAGVIVETEGYIAAIDPAAHGYHGKTKRTEVMYGPPGHLYVYFSYGMHHCCNAVTETDGACAAVLIRALEPTQGIELMRARRGPDIIDRDLLRGPGRLCQGMGITLARNGADLVGGSLVITETPGWPAEFSVMITPRIGLTKATDLPWRFAVAGSQWVSGTRPGNWDLSEDDVAEEEPASAIYAAADVAPARRRISRSDPDDSLAGSRDTHPSWTNAK